MKLKIFYQLIIGLIIVIGESKAFLGLINTILQMGLTNIKEEILRPKSNYIINKLFLLEIN